MNPELENNKKNHLDIAFANGAKYAYIISCLKHNNNLTISTGFNLLIKSKYLEKMDNLNDPQWFDLPEQAYEAICKEFDLNYLNYENNFIDPEIARTCFLMQTYEIIRISLGIPHNIFIHMFTGADMFRTVDNYYKKDFLEDSFKSCEYIKSISKNLIILLYNKYKDTIHQFEQDWHRK